METDPIVLILQALEQEIKKLRIKRLAGEIIGFNDMKLLLHAIGVLLENEEVLAGIREKSRWWEKIAKTVASALKEFSK